MSAFPALDRHRSAQRPHASGAAVRAIALALAGAALVAGLHLATTDYAILQTLLLGWLEPTGAVMPAARLDDHLRLPAAWHHNPLAMAVLNLLAGLALFLLFRSTANLPVLLSYAAAGTVRRWWARLLYVISLVLHRADRPLPEPRRTPRPAVTLPRPHALVVLLHRAQPCAP
ncbi:hypothetical protein [Streptomyces sp. NPDC088360]|uniref:hypothetical protein n=1 Tax=unclassified Streptomyces TaxID=2593676 RepID=UPI00344D856A